jgi:argininosuccinate lyase
LQPAQPVLFAHYLLAYFEMLRRDIERWEDCWKRADELPLGAGALAGNSFGIDRNRLAMELGFARVARNSLDATSDRDFVCEALFACALTLVHLSRLAEDLVIYSSPSFGYVEIADAYSTGSSLMPQKKNPDSLELIRGKAARVLGDLSAMVALLKGLPLAYNRDLQEDKPALFDGLDTTCECLTLAARIVRTLRLRPGPIERAMAEGFLTATDLAEGLVQRGVPFAHAHEQVGKLVKACSARGTSFAGLPASEARRWVPSWDEGLRALAVSPEIALRRKNVVGGTAPSRVAEQMRQAEAALLRLKQTLARRPWMMGDVD